MAKQCTEITVVNVLHIDKVNTAHVIDMLVYLCESVLSQQTGFRKASVLRNSDDTKVVVLATWEHEKFLKAASKQPDVAKAMQNLAELTTPNWDIYKKVYDTGLDDNS